MRFGSVVLPTSALCFRWSTTFESRSASRLIGMIVRIVENVRMNSYNLSCLECVLVEMLLQVMMNLCEQRILNMLCIFEW